MIPPSSLADSVEKTMLLIYGELLERVQNRGWSIHRGVPNPARLPKETVQVWIAPERLFVDIPNSALNTENYQSHWSVHVIRRETASDKLDSSYEELFGDVGKVIEAITSTVAGKGLDGVVDWTVGPNVDFFEPEPASVQDDNVIGALMRIEAVHPLFPCRTS